MPRVRGERNIRCPRSSSEQFSLGRNGAPASVSLRIPAPESPVRKPRPFTKLPAWLNATRVLNSVLLAAMNPFADRSARDTKACGNDLLIEAVLLGKIGAAVSPRSCSTPQTSHPKPSADHFFFSFLAKARDGAGHTNVKGGFGIGREIAPLRGSLLQANLTGPRGLNILVPSEQDRTSVVDRTARRCPILRAAASLRNLGSSRFSF